MQSRHADEPVEQVRGVVILRGTVLTQERGVKTAEAIAFRGEEILTVGSEHDVTSRHPEAEIVDLGERVAVPGFIDPHLHLSIAALHRAAVDLRHCSSIEELLATIRRAANGTPEGDWIYAFGHDESVLGERRHPTAAEIEAASPKNPVFAYHYSCHEGVVSEGGLAALGWSRSTGDPPGGIIERDAKGALTGRLIEAAVGPAEARARASRMARNVDAILDHFLEYERELFAVGITRLADPTVSSDLAVLYRRARAERGLRIPVVMMPSSDRGILDPPWDRLDGSTTGEGDDGLRVGALKLILDGGNRCAMCLGPGQAVGVALRTLASVLLRRSVDAVRFARDASARVSGGAVRTGILYYTDADAQRIVAEAAGHGFALALHAIGNAAVDQALAALAPVQGKRPAGLSPRIEHASVLDRDHPRKIADQGITVVTQPGFLRLPATDQLVLPGSLKMMPLRALWDAGVTVSGSSDAPVTSFDPLVGIKSAVSRWTLSGRELHPEQALTPDEALAMYTINAARALGVDDRVGSLAAGKRADVVVLSHDPRDSHQHGSLRVEQTYLGGELVFDRTASA